MMESTTHTLMEQFCYEVATDERIHPIHTKQFDTLDKDLQKWVMLQIKAFKLLSNNTWENTELEMEDQSLGKHNQERF